MDSLSLEGTYSTDDPLPSGREFTPFPAGNYNMEITQAEVVPPKSGVGKMVKYTARVIGGEHEGRLIFGNFNVNNPNAQAEAIGLSHFAALRKVIGVESPKMVDELCHKQFTAAVKIRPEKNGYGPNNEIDWDKTLKLASGGLPPSKSAPVAAPVATNTAAAKRPWATP